MSAYVGVRSSNILDIRSSGSGRIDGGTYLRVWKRAMDASLAFFAILMLMPIFAIIALAIYIDDGSVLYRQKRVGKDNKNFTLWKFRTMYLDADSRLAELLLKNEDLREEWRTRQKLANDPRVTRTGRWLRKTSLDELPQLWNILVGDMSFVGPRPFMPEQVALYPWQGVHQLRPGLTGPWQVSERNESSFSRRAVYDRWYLRHLSFRTDAAIIAKTFGVVARGTGH